MMFSTTDFFARHEGVTLVLIAVLVCVVSIA
jgi:hypothetical protein